MAVAACKCQMIADSAACPVPRHVMDKHGMAWAEAQNIVTNGPFQLAHWQSGEFAVLVRNSAHFGQSRGNAQR
jgi:ABC-type oligopeptide transport system substrate-binding subunit